ATLTLSLHDALPICEALAEGLRGRDQQDDRVLQPGAAAEGGPADGRALRADRAPGRGGARPEGRAPSGAGRRGPLAVLLARARADRKSTRLNSSHVA